MALHQQRDRPPALRRQLEPAGGGGGGALGLADHRAQTAVAEALLHQREQLGIVRRLGIDHAMRREPGLVQAGGKQVPPAHHPQNRPPGARGDAGEEQGGGGIVARLGRRGGDLVQRVEPQPTVSEPRVERLRPEGQHLATPMPLALDRAERFAQ
jgi:hypothetical protein